MPHSVQGVERLDGPLDDPIALAGNLRDLARVNRWLGGVSLTRRALDALAGAAADRGATITLLDVGTGAADMPVALLGDWERRGRRLQVTAVDSRPEVLAAARVATPAVDGVARLALSVADGRDLPFADDAFDVAHCSLLLHHLDERGAVALLREMSRVARRGVVVNDLAPGRVYWATAWVLARVASTNAYTRHDGPLSVRRAWTLAEAKALLAVAGLRPVADVRTRPGFRWAVAAVR